MTNKPNTHAVLVVDDDDDLREALIDTLSMAGFSLLEANDGIVALELLNKHDIGIVISDVQMQYMDGHTLLKQVKEIDAEIPVILMTAYGTIQKAVEAMHAGAADYLVKPFEAEVLVNMVATFMRTDNEASAGPLIAEDVAMLNVLKLVERVAQSNATVLINGKSGTGKEVIAHEIHRQSPRVDGPFVAINCAAIPENMLEAMLFGYEKGAYTGAYKSSPGKFEQADHGTLLLDEISEMDLGLQAKLLRVIQEREVERLGGTKVISLDVRILATSNRNMKQEVAEGRFREDLYYRLNVFPINLPELKSRPRDIVPIAKHLIQRHLAGSNRASCLLTPDAEQRLCQHHWPGNVRELDNVIQRALILCANNVIGAEYIMYENEFDTLSYKSVVGSDVVALSGVDGRALADDNLADDNLGESLKLREFDLILEALQIVDGSRKLTAEKLGVSERTLRYKLARMRDLGMEIPRAYKS